MSVLLRIGFLLLHIFGFVFLSFNVQASDSIFALTHSLRRSNQKHTGAFVFTYNLYIPAFN